MSVDATLLDSFILFSLSLSLVLSLMVTSSIRFDKRCKRSYHMMLVQRLLRANIGMTLLIGVYVMDSLFISNRRNDSLCAVGLPVLVYFSLVSTSWTLMLALRFRSNQNISTALNKPPFPLEAIWLIWLVPSIIILVFDFSIGHVSIVLHSGGDYNSSCTFDPSSTNGIVSGLVLYQLPLIFIFVWTVYAYIEGIIALRNAPGSVVARQIKRAGGHIVVLFMVWVPTTTYQLALIFSGGQSDFFLLYDVQLLMLSLQGSLNCCVYVYSDKRIMRWLSHNLICTKAAIAANSHRQEDPMMVPHSNPIHRDIDQWNKSHIVPDSGDDRYRDKSVENIEQPSRILDCYSNTSSSKEEQSSNTFAAAVKSSSSSSSSYREDCSVEEEDEDDFQWFSSSPIATSGLTTQIEQRDRESSLLDTLSTYFTNRNKKPDRCSSTDTFHAGGNAPSSGSISSILIDDASAKSLSSKMRTEQQQDTRLFMDMDSNKFVRFGTISTMLFKRHTTESSKASEIDLPEALDRYTQKSRAIINDDDA